MIHHKRQTKSNFLDQTHMIEEIPLKKTNNSNKILSNKIKYQIPFRLEEVGTKYL
jgi:hypothetical protein